MTQETFAATPAVALAQRIGGAYFSLGQSSGLDDAVKIALKAAGDAFAASDDKKAQLLREFAGSLKEAAAGQRAAYELNRAEQNTAYEELDRRDIAAGLSN